MKEVKQKVAANIQPNTLDRIVNFIDPIRGARRMKARAIMALTGAYFGGSKKRRATSQWSTSFGDADSDINPDLPELRNRSRDLIRNNPLASGSIHTKVTSVVGTGLVLKSRIDRNILNMTEDEADLWERRAEAEWKLWSKNPDCDITRTLNFDGIQELSFRSVLENGDTFILTPMQGINGNPYKLQLQLIEADRVCNKDNVPDNETLSGGILKDKSGAPQTYHILKGHPGNVYSKNNEWDEIPAFGSKTGRRNVLHLYRKIRIGQSRGVPDLAPVIETLKQLGDYTNSEAMAAVVSSFFTVFIKSEQAATGLAPMEDKSVIGGSTSDKDYKMGSGAILDLLPNESIEIADPSRPNQAFDQFVLAISRQIGVALELPFEILIKHFTASYSAARAAMLEAWRFFMGRRKWLADVLCQPVYELWMIEAISNGRIKAPGFFSDPLIRQAYLGSEWIGTARGQIDEKKEVEAAEKRVNMGVSTLDEETAALTGGDWETKHPQRVKEHNKRKEAGLIMEPKGEQDEVVSDPEQEE